MRDVLDAVLEGPRVIARHPGAVLVWTLMLTVGLVGPVLAVSVLQGSPAATAETVSLFLIVMGPVLVGLFALMICGVYRAILRPGEPSFALMRIGVSELRAVPWAMAALFGYALVVAVFGQEEIRVGAPIVVLVLVLAAVAGPFAFWGPATFDQRRWALRFGWRSTGGERLKLIVANALATIFGVGLYLVCLSALRPLLDALDSAGAMGGLGMLLLGLSQVAATVMLVIVLTAPPAAAYRRVRDAREDPADVFS